MNWKMSAGALGALVVAPAAAAQQAEGDPAIGGELARQLCTACHIVGAEPVGSDVAPPFAAIAKDPDITLTELHAWSGPAHPALPHLALTPQQIADLNAYLDSLHAPVPEPQEEELPEGASPRLETEQPPPAIQESPPEELGPPIGTEPE